MTPNPTKMISLQRVQGSVDTDDYDYVVKVIGGGEHGLQSEIIRYLFSAFANFVREKEQAKHITSYATSRHSITKLRRYLTIGRWVIGNPEFVVSRTADNRPDTDAAESDESRTDND